VKGTPARIAALAARLALAAALVAPAARAQEAGPPANTLPLVEGTRVRIRAPAVYLGRRIEGSVLRLLVDTVVVDTAPEWRTHRFFGGSTIPLDSLRRVRVHVDSIRQLQVSTGRSRLAGATRWVIRGAVIGALIGGIANTPQRNPTMRDVGDGIIIGAPVGAAIGLVYGLFNPGDLWRTVSLPAIGMRRLGR
jgi:hypothetical protein